MSKTNMGDCSDGAFNFEAHLVAGILDAEVDFGTMQHQPVVAVRMSPELERDDDTFLWQRFHADHPPQRPHAEVRIEVLILQVFARPVVAPRSERIDDGAELPAGKRQAVVVPVFTIGLDLLDDSAASQRLQPLGEQIPGDPGNTAMEIAEGTGSEQQLAQNERRPSFGEDLGTERDGTELSVGRHGSKVRSAPMGGKSFFEPAEYNIVALQLVAGVLAFRGIVLDPAVGAVLMSLSTRSVL